MNRPELPDNVVAHTILVVLKKGDGEVTAYTTVLFCAICKFVVTLLNCTSVVFAPPVMNVRVDPDAPIFTTTNAVRVVCVNVMLGHNMTVLMANANAGNELIVVDVALTVPFVTDVFPDEYPLLRHDVIAAEGVYDVVSAASTHSRRFGTHCGENGHMFFESVVPRDILSN